MAAAMTMWQWRLSLSEEEEEGGGRKERRRRVAST